MSRYLQSYHVSLHTIGPVFIGNGREIGKKEYVWLARNQVGMIDIEKFYTWIAHKGKRNQYEDFLLGNDRSDLMSWLKRQDININNIVPFLKYTLECGDAVLDKGAGKLQVMECIKDAYGNPYIPGSSVKGMFRTILLAKNICSNSDNYRANKDKVEDALSKGGRRNLLLSNEVKGIEARTFCRLNRETTKPQDAVNDILQGLIISDSKPLACKDLVLCQKVDVHTDHTERGLPILRECIKPDIDIEFDLMIDAKVCKLTPQDIEMAIHIFCNQYKMNFASAFRREMPQENFVLLGGGCGYVSKTITYPLYGKDKGIQMTQQIFEKTNVPRVHKHDKDQEYGASPHILKCTKYHGELLQMGLCKYQGATAY